MNDRLIRLGDTLPAFENLDELCVEASAGPASDTSTRWKYLYESSMKSIVCGLPHNLKNLTLDTCASSSVRPSNLVPPSYKMDATHICILLALRLHEFQNVGLRMQNICPCLLTTSSILPGAESRLKSLVIRLYLPTFNETTYNTGHEMEEMTTQPCQRTKTLLYQDMIIAGVHYAERNPSIIQLRISYNKYDAFESLTVADCVRERLIHDTSSLGFDYGWEWGAWRTRSL